MILFDNINDDFDPVPVEPRLVTSIRQRQSGSTVISQVAHYDVITSTNFFEVCYAIGSAVTCGEKDPASGQGYAESNLR